MRLGGRPQQKRILETDTEWGLTTEPSYYDLPFRQPSQQIRAYNVSFKEIVKYTSTGWKRISFYDELILISCHSSMMSSVWTLVSILYRSQTDTERPGDGEKEPKQCGARFDRPQSTLYGCYGIAQAGHCFDRMLKAERPARRTIWSNYYIKLNAFCLTKAFNG